MHVRTRRTREKSQVRNLAVEELEGRLLLSTGYDVETLPVGGDIEHRMVRDGFHFGTLIEKPNGALIFRPHPDQGDVNGFGSSYYLNPFLAGGDPSAGVVGSLSASTDGIDLSASGAVTGRAGATFGTWIWTARLAYDSARQEISSSNGTLDVTLPGTLDTSGADLNLYRLASNFLMDVPLQTGGVGNTGDMQFARVSYGPAGDPRDFTWVPPDQPAHFPGDFSPFISVDVVGELNVVDTLAQGFGFQIAIARKPSLKLTLSSQDPAVPMIFGGIYDLSQAQNFAADNVGINALVITGTTNSTHLEFSVNLESTPPASIVVTPTTGLFTTEAGGKASFSVHLTSPPTSEVSVALFNSNPAEGTIAPSALTFGPADWNVPQEVTVTGVDDSAADGLAAYTIVTGAASSADPNYAGMDPPDVSVVNIDNDGASCGLLGPSGAVLTCVGSTGPDQVQIEQKRGMLEVSFVKGLRSRSSFPIEGVSQIMVFGFEGNDNIDVSSNVTLPAWLFGGPGDDRLHVHGGSLNNVLVGEDGNDQLEAGNNRLRGGGLGRDVMIGGRGQDHLKASAGDNLLIAGFTDFDASLSALEAIQAEWTRSDLSYQDRVDHLLQGGGLNGTTTLNPSTVHDDASRDLLDGAPKTIWSDWFLANLDGDGDRKNKDKVHGLRGGRIATDINVL